MVKGLGPTTIVTNQKTNDGRTNTNTNTNTKSEVPDDDDDLINQVNQRLIWSRQFHRPQMTDHNSTTPFVNALIERNQFGQTETPDQNTRMMHAMPCLGWVSTIIALGASHQANTIIQYIDG